MVTSKDLTIGVGIQLISKSPPIGKTPLPSLLLTALKAPLAKQEYRPVKRVMTIRAAAQRTQANLKLIQTMQKVT